MDVQDWAEIGILTLTYNVLNIQHNHLNPSLLELVNKQPSHTITATCNDDQLIGPIWFSSSPVVLSTTVEIVVKKLCSAQS